MEEKIYKTYTGAMKDKIDDAQRYSSTLTDDFYRKQDLYIKASLVDELHNLSMILSRKR